jgi:hypothetical protein
MITVRVRSLNSPLPSGTLADPCETYCQPLLNSLNISHGTGG